MVKILLVSPLPPPTGGIATWTVRYKQYCDKHAIATSIVNSALKLLRTQDASKRVLLDEISRSLGIVKELICQILTNKPDVVHFNTSCSGFGIYRDCFCVVIAKMLSIPVVLQCHCNIQDQINGKFAEFAFRIMAAASKKVLVLNRFSAAYAGRIVPNRVEVVPNFANDKDLFVRKSVSDTIRNVLFVGHVRKEKGAQEIFEAAEKCKDIHFTLVGPVELSEAELPHCSNVELLGSQPHEIVSQLLRESDAFLFPSYTEGFANALVEAMAAGLPVIATDVGANAEMIENEGGIIIPVKDANAIVEAIQQLQDTPERRLAMGTWNVQKVKNEYLLDAVMSRLIDVYLSYC